MRLHTRFLPLLIAPLALLAACGSDEQPTETTTGGSQIANPASVYCEAQGGTLEIVDEKDGQVGYCNLPDGTRVEEWEFYNSSSANTTNP